MLRQCCNYDGNQEARAWAWNSAAQGLTLVNQLFLGVALLRLAEFSAGCVELSDKECENRVYGMRPSSLLTTATSATGILGALILPPIGALIDRSACRREVGIFTSVIIVAFSASNLMLSERTWFIVLMLSIASAIFYFIHLMVMYSYVPELSENVEQLTSYNGSYIAIRTAVMVPIFPIVIGTAFLMNRNEPTYGAGSLEFDVLLAKIAQIITVILTSICFTLTFYKGLKSRPPKIKVGDDSKKINIRDTAWEIFRHNRPLFWYLLALIPLANTAMAFGTISLTFMTIFLSMDSLQIGMTIIIFTCFGVLGSKVHPLIARRINLMNDLKLNVIGWIVVCLLTGILVNDRGLKIRFICISIFWGFIFGWSIPSMRTVFITLIPVGQEAEYMGIYILFSGGFVWLPPLLFTILNETGIRMNVIIMIAALLFVLTLILLFLVGDYQKATENAKALGTKHQRKKDELLSGIEVASTSEKENEPGDIVKGDVEANEENFTQTESDDSLDN